MVNGEKIFVKILDSRPRGLNMKSRIPHNGKKLFVKKKTEKKIFAALSGRLNMFYNSAYKLYRVNTVEMKSNFCGLFFNFLLKNMGPLNFFWTPKVRWDTVPL